MRAKTKPIAGAATDKELRYITRLDPEMEQWRKLGAEWLAQRKQGHHHTLRCLRHFMVSYILGQKLEKVPEVFLRRGHVVPDFVETSLQNVGTQKDITRFHNLAVSFIDYVLQTHFTIEDDNGNAIVSPVYCNPLPPLDSAHLDGRKSHSDESNKNVLPYQYITALRDIVCPKGGQHFKQWKWAQQASDWFIAAPDMIDREDPDCVWRERPARKNEQKTYGYGSTVLEMWSPVSAVALLIKLHLPLRTYQVRMLDSGEADTQRYEKGQWVPNKTPLAQGSAKHPVRRGVFRQMTDQVHGVSMTGLFVNTNKTADQGKDEWTRGYIIPWEHPEVLYWLEKLRDWQEKYNPISKPTSWTQLELRHLGITKHEDALRRMGDTVFLFRDVAALSEEDRHKPVPWQRLEILWSKLLLQLEAQCAAGGQLDLTGQPLRFHTGRNTTTFYSLHALRVSLITAYALEGGVPLQVLSKCIAGHSRLVMTLYYTKAGITYCTDVMEEATKRLLETEQDNMVHWLKDKTFEQLEAKGAYHDPTAIGAVIHAMQEGGASLARDDKGVCAKGGWGCDTGGVYINGDTGKTTYGEVPGYPQKNCPRCRWFFTGPAFIDGLQNHWNNIMLLMGDVGERIVRLEGEIEQLEDAQYECQRQDRIFQDGPKLAALRKAYQGDIEKNNKHAEDSQATYRLIARCRVLLEDGAQDDGVRLVAVGALPEVRIAIEECGKLHQVLAAVANSSVYPEHDVSRAVLDAGVAFDRMLVRNGREPVFFTLDEDERWRVAQHTARLLAAYAGSIQNAVPFIEGGKRLSEIGLDLDLVALAKEMVAAPALGGHDLKLIPRLSDLTREGASILAYDIDQEDQEISNAAA